MPSLSSAILFEDKARAVVVIDLPRSIEEAQQPEYGSVPRRRRLLSAPAPSEPFPMTPEPLPGSAGSMAMMTQDPAAQLAELTTAAAVETALGCLQESHFDGPWCLSRMVKAEEQDSSSMSPPLVPPGARYLAGTIAVHRQEFLDEAPTFDLIVLDPPWPNRSARRRRQGRKHAASSTDTSYATTMDMESMRTLLEAVPVGAKLAGNDNPEDRPPGLVAVWVTNKPACTALLTDPRHGVFRAWGVELVSTWTWLKVTTAGEPVVSPESQWRKPWERLLLARRPGRRTRCPAIPLSRVIIGVPDVHSRKPHLRPLLAPFLSDGQRPLVGLEVFARNLTADWWAWGDETLLFQQPTWWTEDTGDTGDTEKQQSINE